MIFEVVGFLAFLLAGYFAWRIRAHWIGWLDSKSFTVQRVLPIALLLGSGFTLVGTLLVIASPKNPLSMLFSKVLVIIIGCIFVAAQVLAALGAFHQATRSEAGTGTSKTSRVSKE